MRLGDIIECYFTIEIDLAFRAHFQRRRNDEKLKTSTSFHCYCCNAYVSGKAKFEKHLTVCCGKKPGITYKFNNKHLTNFEDNFRLLGDQSFSVYFDLKTTCGKSTYCTPEDPTSDMYVVSYCFIVAFHQTYSLNKITVLRSFNDSLQELADASYLSDEMLEFRDGITNS